MVVRLALLLALLGMVLSSTLIYMVATSDLWLERIRRRLDAPSWTQEKFANELLAYHDRLDASLPPGMALFFGDSLTQSLCVSCVAEDAVNYGIGGDTTRGLLERLSTYGTIENARVSVVAIGLNDLRTRSPGETAETYTQILERFPRTGRLVLSAILPIDEASANDARSNAAIQDLNTNIAALCAERHRCSFVNLGDALRAEDGGLDRAFHVGDGIHLNGKGYQIWVDHLRAELLRLDLANGRLASSSPSLEDHHR